MLSFLKKRSFAVCAAMGVGGALALTALLMLPGALLVGGETLPERYGWIYALGAAGLSVLAVTAIIGRARGREVLATGGAVAAAYVLLAALLCALGGKNCAFGMWLACLAGAVAAGGAAGAMLSVRHNAHHRRRIRHF